jgi:hypothetical protein
VSIEAILGIVGLSLSAIGVIAGWVWWLSATYAQLKGLRKDFVEFAHAQAENNKRLWERTDRHSERLQVCDVRLTRVEGKLAIE